MATISGHASARHVRHGDDAGRGSSQPRALRPPPHRRRLDERADVTATIARLLGMSYQERAPNHCIGVERADLVLAGCAILDAIRNAFPLPRLRVADRGLREGMLVEMMREDGVLAGAKASTSLSGLTRQSIWVDEACIDIDGFLNPVCVKTGSRRNSTDHGERYHRPAARHRQERRQAKTVVKTLAGAPAQRSLCGAGQARRLPLARGLQADRDRRQAALSQARRDGGRSRRGARRLEPDRGQARRRADGKGKVVAIDLLEMPEIVGVTFAQLDFLEADAPEKCWR